MTVEPDRAAFADLAADAPSGARVPVVGTVRADPFAAYRRARGDAPAVFLETGGGQSGWGYFGVDPDEVVTVDGDGVLDRLRAVDRSETLVRGDCTVPYPGGWFGWLAYDVAREIEDLPDETVDDRGLPRCQLARYPTVAAWREPHDGETTLHLASAVRVDGDPDAAYDRARDRVAALADAATDGDPSVGVPPAGGAGDHPRPDAVAFEGSCSRAAYADRVRAVQRAIRDGETFQVNVSHRLAAPAAVHPVTVYDALREANPAPYAGLLEFPGVDLVSASPELLLSVDPDPDPPRLETEPIAGTRPRGADADADAALAADLRADEKERAEHAMLVDLERNDLGKVSAYGSVDVPEYRRVDRYSEVMHIVSRVTGRLRPDADLADAVRAVFPGGTITGAPKPRTMELIERLESTRRGPYTGSVAAVGFDGRATLNIAIRTLVRTGDRYHLRVGAGVVHDSVPDREYDETLDKARALVDAVDAALGRQADLEVAE